MDVSVQEESYGRNTRKDRKRGDDPRRCPDNSSAPALGGNHGLPVLVLVRIRCADGIEGKGERTTIGGLAYGEESPESVKVNIDTHFALDVEVRALCRHASSIREDDR
jgi:hypothetical protein